MWVRRISRDLAVLQLVVEPVAAQEQPVALAQRLVDHRRIRRADAERLRHEILVRMAAQLGLRQVLLLAQDLEIGVIAGQLAQRLPAPQVGAAVADPDNLRMPIHDARRDHRRAHVGVRGVVCGGLCDLFVRSLHGRAQRHIQCRPEERLFDQAARDVAAGVAAHAVRDEVQAARLVPADRVLVLAALVVPDVCVRRNAWRRCDQNERCALAAAVANCWGLNAVSFFTALKSGSSAAFFLS